eukprot:TRINITY_DN14236_c0_g1_i1.p2 TRINITY_DN14236_c0_g1~~TRINITY_DN14236_c0_g1_i1.p2  ORF type:complete len:348 (+),score=104.58 TRINITY_DN14236_c0_g1_i1:34-1077(+)
MAAASAAYDDFITALGDPRVTEVEDDVYAEPEAQVRVVEVDAADGGGCVIAVPPALQKPIAKTALFKLKAAGGVGGAGDELVRLMLLINPEWSPGWIKFQRAIAAAAGEEQVRRAGALLRFSTLLLHRHPKSHEGWKTRRWLTQRCPGAAAAVARDTEIDLALHCCGAYYRNYYAWGYLIELVTEAGVPAAEHEALLARVRTWAQERPSDHSALVFLETLAERVLEADGADVAAVLGRAAAFAEELLDRRPTHESIWSHLRWLTLQESARLARPPAARLSTALAYLTRPAPKDALLMKEHAEVALSAGRYCRWVLAHLPSGATSPPQLPAALRAEVEAHLPVVRVGV